MFTVGSVHEGTIVNLMDKGATVQLEYGVEGFVTPKHLTKEDGSKAKLNEKLPFKVIEFNKDSHRIILSHSRTFEENAHEEKQHNNVKAPKKDDNVQIKNQAAANSLGDNDTLAALKAKMEKGE